jgi:hypothetical protein
MADYVAHARSNYFAVTDPKAFEALCRRWDLRVITKDLTPNETLYGFLCMDGSLPGTSYLDDETDEEIEADFYAELAALLVDGDVAVLCEAGYEGHRYVTGYALALNRQNEQIAINIDDIYDRAKTLGSRVEVAGY